MAIDMPYINQYIYIYIYLAIQVFLLVRGGLRRKILVDNDIITFESVFSSFCASPRRPLAKSPGGK